MMKTKPPRSLKSIRALALAILCASVPILRAAPPDLTAGGVPNEDPAITINLGPTGARGWVYHVKTDTGQSRQILVTTVDSGSPAAGILAADDVILGADGTGATPVNFSSDARKSLAYAIAAAEANTPATLKLLRWRSGTTSTVELTLQTMGAYTTTAPYNCPKSTKILQDGLQYVYDHEDAGRYSFGAITLLATGDPTYQAKAQTEARALIPSQATMNQMMSDARDASSMITWQRGHTLVFLAEYYLATNDTQVLPAIEAYAVNIAKNQSLFGTVGHIFADKNDDGSANGPMGGVYGVVNSAGMPCFLGVLLAKKCGLTNPELDPAIEASSRFFAYYTGKGAIPYGEHEPYIAHESNGKCGLAALYFGLQNNRVEETKFFAKMATASYNERELGHTGSFFNYLWASLGAAAGGQEAVAAYFSRISWMLDLNRRWDGGFDYDCLNGEGPNSGASYHDFKMSTAALLTYALPEHKLYITGRDWAQKASLLSAADVTEAVEAGDYDANPRSDSELISDLGNWSPKVRKQAAQELKTRSISASELSQITTLANNTGASSRSRAGACLALGEIGDSSSAAPLAALLTDSDRYVRYAAGEAMRYLPASASFAQRNTILAAAASTAEPLYPMVDEDPLHFAHGKLAMLLFYSGSAYGPKGILWGSGINGVDRNLLYPAIRAVAENPVGLSRSTLGLTYNYLTYDDVLALSGTIVDSIAVRSPSDKMFSAGIREGGVKVLEKFGIAEGVPTCMIYADDEVGGRRNTPLGLLGTFGGRVHTVTPDPDAVSFLQSYLSDGETAATAQASLDSIAADTNPTPLVAFKSIQSVTADDTTVTLPADSTILRVTAMDYAQGDSIYTWQELSGPGGVSFTPNGTAAAVTSTVQFDGTPGVYQFEVTMSDSRGLTEVYETVGVELSNGGGGDVSPPGPNPATFAIAPAADGETSISMTATTGSDGSGPVEYLFAETSGNPGATSSQWQTSPAYTDAGLDPETTYTYTVTMRDVLGNTGTASAPSSATTTASRIFGELGIMDLTANGGINPNTGVAWQVGDQYRLAFHTVGATGTMNGTSNDPADYNTYVTAEAHANPALAGSTWFAMVTVNLNGATTQALSAKSHVKDNTGTADLTGGAGIGGAGLPVYAMDGTTCIARNNADIWNDWSNPFDGGSTIRVAAPPASQAVHYSPFLDQFGNQTVTPDDVHGIDVATGAGSNGAHVNALGNTTDDTTFNRGNANANSAGRIWNRFTDSTSTNRSFYALSEPLTVQGDFDPPTPNPASFAVAPAAVDSTSISMTATTGSDSSGSVEYLFTETSGNSGGTSSGWQGSASYTDTGLSSSTPYTYTVTMRDTLGNIGTASAEVSATTDAGNNFSDWIAVYPGVGAQTGFAEDPDGDGIANGLENFFGINPGVVDGAGLQAEAFEGNTVTFTHPQGTLADDLTAAYQWSKDLLTFNADGAADGDGTRVDFSVQIDTPSPGTTTVTAAVSGGPVPDKFFVRVVVTQN